MHTIWSILGSPSVNGWVFLAACSLAGWMSLMRWIASHLEERATWT